MIVADAVVIFVVVFTLLGIGCCVVTLAHYSHASLLFWRSTPGRATYKRRFHVLYFDKNVLTHFVRKTC